MSGRGEKSGVSQRCRWVGEGRVGAIAWRREGRSSHALGLGCTGGDSSFKLVCTAHYRLQPGASGQDDTTRRPRPLQPPVATCSGSLSHRGAGGRGGSPVGVIRVQPLHPVRICSWRRGIRTTLQPREGCLLASVPVYSRVCIGSSSGVTVAWRGGMDGGGGGGGHR